MYLYIKLIMPQVVESTVVENICIHAFKKQKLTLFSIKKVKYTKTKLKIY